MAEPVLLERVEGWESRLVAVIEAARVRTYALGQWDCFALACASVAAVTGVDFWPQWQGRYATRREAVALIAAYAGHGDGNAFTRAFSKLFGAAPVPMSFGRRGDIAEFVDATGQQHLGVVLGRDVAVMDEQMTFVSRKACVHAWRIG